MGNAGRVHQNVHLAEFLEHGVVQSLERSPVLHVTGHTQRAPAQRLNLRGRPPHLRRPPRTGHHIGPGFSQAQRNRMAQTGGSADHHRHSTAQIEKAPVRQNVSP